MVHPRVTEHRRIWEQKPVLRAVYSDYAHRIREACVAGTTAEVGAGSGWLADLLPVAVRTDLLLTPWVDVAARAEELPLRTGSISNVVGVDVLHHFPRPRAFFSEVERVLQPQGRCILIEPAITPLSWAFLTAFHEEPVELFVDPLADQITTSRDPFEANQAIPTLLFGGEARRFKAAFPTLRVHCVSRFSFLAYPLSGGFRRWSLIPTGWVGGLLGLEAALAPMLGPFSAFRLMIVLEKSVSGSRR